MIIYPKYTTTVIGAHSVPDWYEALDRLLAVGQLSMASMTDAQYRAGQAAPVKRQVALKLIKVGMDSRAVLARFDAERQALALMDHPNIARIYDGGVTPAGAMRSRDDPSVAPSCSGTGYGITTRKDGPLERGELGFDDARAGTPTGGGIAAGRRRLRPSRSAPSARRRARQPSTHADRC